MAKLYPIGIQNFEKIRREGYLYIDKTALVCRLVKTGSYYFLSRPRRFGKSLLISTLEAYFQGKKDLFRGLAMEELEKDWIKYPILHLDLNTEKYDTPESLDRILNDTLAKWEMVYGTAPSETSIPLRFKGIVQRACEQSGQRVVILIDEYDKPMLQAIGNEELGEKYRDTLKGFYSVLKTMDGYIRFALLTGVTKFGKVSVFSDLNNLNDISMDEPYVELCGITEKEIHHYLEPEIRQLAKYQKMSYEDACRELKERYDGYHFTENSIGLYNPFSILNTFYKMKFGSYWFETGTPSYLVKLLLRDKYDLQQLAHDEATSDTPYELVRDLELHYQNVLFIVYKLLGFYVQAEYHTSNGRIDMVLKTDRYIYVMEFKFDGSAEEALKQIEEKGYAVPFANDSRQLIKVGVNFSSKTRNIVTLHKQTNIVL